MLLQALEALLLVSALSLDALVASFSFGVEKIKVPWLSALFMSGICSAFLAVSLLLGSVVKPYVSPHLAAVLSFLILLILGITRLLDSAIKTCIKKSCTKTKDIKFKLLDLHFMLRIYADSTEADVNHSKSLSVGEASSLAVALSLDGFATGFGAGLTNANPVEMILFSFIIGLIAIRIGCAVGRRVASSAALNLSWAGGAILILLAFTKLF